MSPIRDEALRQSKNAHVLGGGDQTLHQVAKKIEAAGGQPWWHVVVDLGDGRYATALYSALIKRAEDAPEAERISLVATRLRDLGEPLIEVEVVEQDSVSTTAAENLASASPGELVVVTRDGKFAGILYVGGRRSADLFAASSLLELPGIPSDLASVGDELLDKPPADEELEEAVDSPFGADSSLDMPDDADQP
jgi:hypothetical protein